IEYGLDGKAVQGFPATQVVLLDEKRAFEIRDDDQLKWINQPAWQAEAALRGRPPVEPGEDLLLGGLPSYVSKVRRALGRLEQKLALLRVVEALRMHAAANQGQLPEKLTDIKG